MIRAVRAIVRRVTPEYPFLEPGTVMAVSSLAFEPSSAPRFPATAEIKPDLLFWLSPNDLLPYSKFLRRQPLGEFWMLALKERVSRSREPIQFLASQPDQ